MRANLVFLHHPLMCYAMEEESIKEKFIAFAKNHPWKSLGLFILVHAILTTLVLGFPSVFLALGLGFVPSIMIGGYLGKGKEEGAITRVDPKVVAAIWAITYFIVTGYAWYCYIRGIPWMR